MDFTDPVPSACRNPRRLGKAWMARNDAPATITRRPSDARYSNTTEVDQDDHFVYRLGLPFS